MAAEATEHKVPAKRVRVQAPAVYRPDGDNLLAVIAAAAIDPRCDVAKMQALLDMQERIERRDAEKAFNAAFLALQAELPAIRRDGKIEIREKNASGSREGGRVQQSTPYATFNNIHKVLKPLLTKHGFGLSFATEPVGERLLVKGILMHEAGHFRETSFPLPAETSGSKNNVQGWGSSMSYGKRYCTIALVNIVSEADEDADTDGYRGKFVQAAGGGMAEVPEKAELVTKAQRDELVDLITKAKIRESQFCTHYGVDQIGKLPADLFEAAKKAIAEHVAKQGERRG